MDYLREGIHLRGFAQIDPLIAYKNEGFGLFEDLMNSIWSDFARMVYNVQVEVEGQNGDSAAPLQQQGGGAGHGGAEASSRAVALLELLARPAPAGVVAADLLVLVDAPLLDDGLLVTGRLAGLAVGGRLVLERSA